MTYYYTDELINDDGVHYVSVNVYSNKDTKAYTSEMKPIAYVNEQYKPEKGAFKKMRQAIKEAIGLKNGKERENARMQKHYAHLKSQFDKTQVEVIKRTHLVHSLTLPAGQIMSANIEDDIRRIFSIAQKDKLIKVDE